MRAIAISAVILLLSGCATQAERAAAMQSEVDDMIKVYGPACEKLGYKNDTDPWRNCILHLATKDSLERARREPVFTNCIGHYGFFQCSAL